MVDLQVETGSNHGLDAAPYEKMYMIDEAEWMKLKNVQFPTAAENQHPNDRPPQPQESEYETDDNDDDDGDENRMFKDPASVPGARAPIPRFQAPAQVS